MSEPTNSSIGPDGGASDVVSQRHEEDSYVETTDGEGSQEHTQRAEGPEQREPEEEPGDALDHEPRDETPEASLDELIELGAVSRVEEEDILGDVPAQEDVVRSHLKGLLEALIFASDRPLTPGELAKTAKAERSLVRALLRELQDSFEGHGIRLIEVAGGYAFRTAPAYGPFVRDVAAQKPVKMSRAQLETLAIVAYRQPMTRPEIDEVRGVDSGPVLKTLLERGLIRILGKRDEPGRPLIYGTTSGFLSFFNLKSLKDLPSLREFTELSDDSRRTFEKVLGEDAPEQLDLGEAITGQEQEAPADDAGEDDTDEVQAATSQEEEDGDE